MAHSAICSVEECGKPVKTAGMCGLHYQRYRRHGDPLAGRALNGETEQFFNEIVLTYDGRDCLVWPYTRNNKGYPQIYRSGRVHLAHRLVCAHVHGPSPTPKHEAAHSCGKGHLGCVNWRHLSWKTHADNQADKIDHGTTLRGELRPNSKLTEADVRRIRALKGKMSQREIASMFGVIQQTVAKIQSGGSWTWLR